MTDELFAKHLTKLPKTVKVGAYRYSLQVVPASDPDLLGDSGCTDLNTRRITINETIDFQGAVNTVIHELNHAVFDAVGLTDESSEEDYATRSANGWMALRLDNVKLEAWINRALRLLRKSK